MCFSFIFFFIYFAFVVAIRECRSRSSVQVSILSQFLQSFVLILLSPLPFLPSHNLTLEQNKISFALSPLTCMDTSEETTIILSLIPSTTHLSDGNRLVWSFGWNGNWETVKRKGPPQTSADPSPWSRAQAVRSGGLALTLLHALPFDCKHRLR
jgi:hypothetical protein